MSCYLNNHKEEWSKKLAHTYVVLFMSKMEITQYSHENLVTTLGYCDLKFVTEIIKIQL